MDLEKSAATSKIDSLTQDLHMSQSEAKAAEKALADLKVENALFASKVQDAQRDLERAQ